MFIASLKMLKQHTFCNLKEKGCFDQALVTSVASQCLLHCGDEGVSTQVQHSYFDPVSIIIVQKEKLLGLLK